MSSQILVIVMSDMEQKWFFPILMAALQSNDVTFQAVLLVLIFAFIHLVIVSTFLMIIDQNDTVFIFHQQSSLLSHLSEFD